MSLCHLCGQPSIGDSKLCDAPKCAEASALITLADTDSRGIARIRKGWCSQTEAERVRKGMFLRILPSVADRAREHARKRGASLSELVEQWMLSLPLE